MISFRLVNIFKGEIRLLLLTPRFCKDGSQTGEMALLGTNLRPDPRTFARLDSSKIQPFQCHEGGWKDQTSLRLNCRDFPGQKITEKGG